MPCTTVLVGRKASNDGSTMIARTDDGHFDVKKLIKVNPKDQPKKYISKISHVEIELPENPRGYTSCPSVDPKDGVWAATGINEANVGITATETITSNPRVLAADPPVEYKKAKTRKEKDVPGGIGEERHRRGGYRGAGAALYPQRPGGRGTAGKAVGAVRHL